MPERPEPSSDHLPPQPGQLDGLVRLAAASCDAAAATLAFTDPDAAALAATLGYDPPPPNRLEAAFSPLAAAGAQPLVIPDALADPAFAPDPAAAAGPRFYAGVPLRTRHGQVLGTLSVQDAAPRPGGLPPRQQDALLTLAAQVVALLDLRRAEQERDARSAERQPAAREREALAGAAPEGGAPEPALEFAIVATGRDGRVTDWNSGAESILGWPAAAMRGQTLERLFTPGDNAAGAPAEEMRAALEHGRAGGERWHLRRGGARFWARTDTMPLRDGSDRHVGFVTILRDRTLEDRAGLDLRETRAALQRAQTAGGVGLFSVENDTNLLRATPEFCRLFGVPVRETMPPEEVERLVLPGQELIVSNSATRASGDVMPDVEYRIRRADDGELRWISRRAEVERDGDGKPVRFFGVVRDITDRRLATDALARSEERYRALFEAVDDGFCIIEFIDGPHGPASDYVHLEANPGYARHTGIPDVVGKTLRGLAPAEAEGWLEIYGEVLRTGRPIRFEREFRKVGRHIEVSAARIEPASRRQVSVLFRDVTARKQSEEALRASEALARDNIQRVQLALAAGAIIGTWHWDIAADRFTVDEAFARTFGLDPTLGRTGLSLEQVVATVHPDDKPGLAGAIEKAVARGGAYAHQYRVRRTDGNYYWIEANGRVDHAPDGTPVSFPGVLIDVQERRAVEAERDRAAAALRALNETLEQRVTERTAELMRAEEQLRQSQKMEAVGQLTGGLAHDFNNLLTGITGSLELLGRRIDQGRLADLERYVGTAQGAARRAAALTHRLLAFSRRQTLDPRPTDVNRLIAGMEELVRRTVGPAIEIEVVGAGGLWLTLVDPPQLENALLNLCINARDAMPDGGRLTIETANRWLDERAAHGRDLPPGQYVSLCVSDTGTGMTPEVIAKAFDPFFTTKPLGHGTGLGLSMIYGFTRQSGGQSRIYSELGHGTMVCLYLPRYLGDAELADNLPNFAHARVAEEGETVLVVDDEPSVRMLVMEVLEELGYAAIEAADGASGLLVLQSDVRVDLLVTDVGLPGGMNGRQMADAARIKRPDLKVLFITGYAENAVVGNGHLEPGMHVLTKPFAMDVLANRIQTLIENR